MAALSMSESHDRFRAQGTQKCLPSKSRGRIPELRCAPGPRPVISRGHFFSRSAMHLKPCSRAASIRLMFRHPLQRPSVASVHSRTPSFQVPIKPFRSNSPANTLGPMEPLRSRSSLLDGPLSLAPAAGQAPTSSTLETCFHKSCR